VISSEILIFVEATSVHAFYPRSFRVNKAGIINAAAGQTSSSVAIIARYKTMGELGPLIAWS
jgi:6-phosphogluconolactonase (cycloisomerase 2 family)